MSDLAQNLRPAVSLSAEVLFHFGRNAIPFRPMGRFVSPEISRRYQVFFVVVAKKHWRVAFLARLLYRVLVNYRNSRQVIGI